MNMQTKNEKKFWIFRIKYLSVYNTNTYTDIQNDLCYILRSAFLFFELNVFLCRWMRNGERKANIFLYGI